MNWSTDCSNNTSCSIKKKANYMQSLTQNGPFANSIQTLMPRLACTSTLSDHCHCCLLVGTPNNVESIGEKQGTSDCAYVLFDLGLCCLQGWLGVAKVSCHRGIQLILAYSWARLAILVVGKGRGEMFLFLLFLYFHSCSSLFSVPLFHLHYYLFYLFSPFLWEMIQNDPQGLTCH